MATYTNENDEWAVSAYQLARGTQFNMGLDALEKVKTYLPDSIELSVKEFSEGWYEVEVVTPLDVPAPQLEGERLVDHGRYAIQRPWPIDATINGGGSGLVFRRDGSTYGTAFIEATLNEPATFLRGEGDSIEEAEEAAWAKYLRYTANDHEHEFETRGYTNGAGFCKHCGLFKSKAFSLQEIGSICHICGDDMYGTIGGLMYCEQHQPSFEERQRLREEARAAGEPVNQLDELFDALTEQDAKQ